MDPEKISVLLGLVWAVKNKMSEEKSAEEMDMLQELDDIERELESKAIRARAFATEKFFEEFLER